MKIKMISITLCLMLFLSCTFRVFAASSYVLPYPSVMPGGLSYKVHLIWDKLMQYWYFGSFGQFEYNLKESDKFLVEAKTLFEYQQYLLGYQALQKSDKYFSYTLPFLQKAQQEGKDISQKRTLLNNAALKHKEVLEKMEQDTPGNFFWSPEKSPASILNLHQLIDVSLKERGAVL